MYCITGNNKEGFSCERDKNDHSIMGDVHFSVHSFNVRLAELLKESHAIISVDSGNIVIDMSKDINPKRVKVLYRGKIDYTDNNNKVTYVVRY